MIVITNSVLLVYLFRENKSYGGKKPFAFILWCSTIVSGTIFSLSGARYKQPPNNAAMDNAHTRWTETNQVEGTEVFAITVEGGPRK